MNMLKGKDVMKPNQEVKKGIVLRHLSQWTVGATALLLSASLVLSACVAPTQSTPGAAPDAASTAEVDEATTTPGVGDSDTVTDTDDITGSEDITGTDDITGTEDMTGSEEITGTDTTTD